MDYRTPAPRAGSLLGDGVISARATDDNDMIGFLVEPALEQPSRVAAPLRSVSRHRDRGITLLELMIALIIVGILSTIAVESYSYARDKANIAQAKADLVTIASTIERYYTTNNAYPANLTEIGLSGMRDPWGNPYQYLDITTQKGKGKLRKDRKDNPINTDFDLYSLGKDGVSKQQLQNKDSLDDIIRARNGAFIGLAADY